MRLFTAAAATLCLVALVHAQGFREFRIPTNSARAVSIYVQANGNSGDSRNDTRAQDGWFHAGQMSLRGLFYYDSEDLGWQVTPSFIAEGSTSNSNDDERLNYGSEDYHSNSSRVNETLRTNAQIIYFPTSTALGFEAGGLGGVGVSQYWSHLDRLYASDDDIQTARDLWDFETNELYYDASFELGVGWGRVRNASSVHGAHLLEERLQELGMLSGELSEETVQKLVEHGYTSSEYYLLYSRSEKYSWRDVEKILESDPAFHGPLNAYAAHRLTESMSYPGISHWRGIRAGLYARAIHANELSLQTRDYFHTQTYDTLVYADTSEFGSQTFRDRSDEIMVGPGLQGYFPLSYAWQINADSRLERRISPADDGFAWSNFCSVEHLLSDRLSVRYTLEHLRWLNDSKNRDDTRGSSWMVHHELIATVFVEDHVDLSVSARSYQYQLESYVPNWTVNVNPVEFGRNTNYFLTLTYRIHGYAGETVRKAPRSRYIRTIDNFPSSFNLPGNNVVNEFLR